MAGFGPGSNRKGFVSAKVAEIVIIAYIVSMKASIPLSSSGTRRVGKDRSPAETTAAVSKPGRMIEPALAALVAELGKRGLPPSAYRRLLRSLLMPLDRTIEPPKSSAARRDKRRRSVSAALDPEPNHGSCAAPAIEASAFAPGARAKAVLRGVEIAEADLRSSGGAYDLEQVQQLLHGVSRQRIDKRVREGSLLAVPGPSNKRRYPAVQFKDDGTVVDGLPDVLEALPTKNGFAILNFLVRPDRRLDGRRPIDLLEAGQVDLVVEAAQRMGEQGA